MNESLTSRQAELYVKTHQLVTAKQVNRCWTYDERICVKLCGLRGKKIVNGTLEDLDKFQDDDGIKEMEQRFASTPLFYLQTCHSSRGALPYFLIIFFTCLIMAGNTVEQYRAVIGLFNGTVRTAKFSLLGFLSFSTYHTNFCNIWQTL